MTMSNTKQDFTKSDLLFATMRQQYKPNGDKIKGKKIDYKGASICEALPEYEDHVTTPKSQRHFWGSRGPNRTDYGWGFPTPEDELKYNPALQWNKWPEQLRDRAPHDRIAVLLEYYDGDELALARQEQYRIPFKKL